MGNSLGLLSPVTPIVAGNLERGQDALYLLLTNNKDPTTVEEHSPSGVTTIDRKRLSDRENGKLSFVDCAQNVNRNNSTTVLVDNITSSVVLPPGRGRKSKPGFQQEFMEDVVYSVLYLLENPRSENHVTHSRGVSWNLEGHCSKNRQNSTKIGKKSSLKHNTSEENENKKYAIPGRTPECRVSRKELINLLMDLFAVKEEAIVRFIAETKKRKPSKVIVSAGVIEARNLRPKLQKDTSNPYCIVRIVHKLSPSPFCMSLNPSGDVFKTHVVQDSVEPRWNALFEIDDADPEGSKLLFEVWHATNENSLDHLVDKIHFNFTKGLKKETRNLLGFAIVDLENCKHYEFDNWLKLIKAKDETLKEGSLGTAMKKRGEIHVTIKTRKKVSMSYKDKENFRRFLNAIADIHMIESESQIPPILWNGKLTPAEHELIYSYASEYNISPTLMCCSWWLILSSDERSIDQKYLYTLAASIQLCFDSNLSGDDKGTEEFRDSIVNWMNLQITKIKDLQTFFPSSLGLTAKHQLTFCLRTLKFLEQNLPPSLIRQTVSPFNLSISDALHDFVQSWWKSNLSLQQRFNITEASTNNRALTSSSNVPVSRNSETPYKRHIPHKYKSDAENIDVTLSQFRATNYSFYRSFHGSSGTKFQNTRKTRRNSLDGTPLATFSKPSNSSIRREERENCLLNNTLGINQEQEIKINRKKALNAALLVIENAFLLLEEISNSYNEIFYTEFQIPFFQRSFIYLSNEISSFLQPFFNKMYSSNLKEDNLTSRADPLALEVGTPTFEIYKCIRKLERLCMGHEFSKEIQLQSGLSGYWEWLSGGVSLWLQRTMMRAMENIIRDVQDDPLQDSNEGVLHSFSSISTIEIHKMVTNAWHRLCWPAEDRNGEWILKIGKGLCSLSNLYGKQIKEKLERDLCNSTEFHQHKKICITINNLIIVGESVLELPQFLKKTSEGKSSLEDEEELMKLSQQIEKAHSELHSYAATILNETMGRAISEMNASLQQSCTLQSEVPMIEYLKQEIMFHKVHLLGLNFESFLQSFWTSFLDIFVEIIEENKHKQNHSFFVCLSKCLKRAQLIFQDEDSYIEFQSYEGYTRVKESLTHLQMSNDALFANYFKERYYEQQNNSEIICCGEMAVRPCIDRTGKLTVDVILAKNLVASFPSGLQNYFVKHDSKTRRVLPNTYAAIRLVPTQKFKNIPTHKTKVQKKSTNPVFNATFEFSLGNILDRIESGTILVSVYSQVCCTVGDRLIGESLFPLSSVPKVFSIDARNKPGRNLLRLSSDGVSQPEIKNFFLKITLPSDIEDYESLRALELRTWDKDAQKFLKDIKK